MVSMRTAQRSRNVTVGTAVDWVLETAESAARAQLAKGAADDGVASLHGRATSQLWTLRTSALLKSPLYLAPEHLTRAAVDDPRADVWTLGVILYELIAGVRPFCAESLSELAARLLSVEEAPRLDAACPDVPAGLADIVATCLQKAPAERFADLADLADALAGFGGVAGRRSAARIVAMLGMPARRATLAVRATPSGVRTR
jgi:serine/threonine-protein kinase